MSLSSSSKNNLNLCTISEFDDTKAFKKGRPAADVPVETGPAASLLVQSTSQPVNNSVGVHQNLGAKIPDRTLSGWWWQGSGSDWAAAGACGPSSWAGPDTQT